MWGGGIFVEIRLHGILLDFIFLILRHVIVAGYITEESVAGFFKDFLHPDREDSQTTVVILSP